MKRRRSLPLLRAIEPDVYLFDTSAWLNVDADSDSNGLWALIVKLIEQGRIVSCTEVIREMKEDSIYLLRINSLLKKEPNL